MNTKAFLLFLLASAAQASLREGLNPEESAGDELEPNQSRCSLAQAEELCPNSRGCQDRSTKFAIARRNGYRCIAFPAVCGQIAQGKECYVLDAATEPADAEEPAE